MAQQKGDAANSVAQGLTDRPYEFDFFQAVRRLECAHEDLPRVGSSARPQDDLVRFGQNVSLSFAPSALHAFSREASEGPGKMSVNFFGLLGVNGPLPTTITEYVYDRIHNHGDQTLAHFLDLFNHRMLSLFYRAWACNQQTVSFDRRDEDSFALYFGSLFGMGAEPFCGRDSVNDDAKLHYCGRLSCPTKNPEGLESILSDYLELPVTIQEFVGQWIDIPPENYCRFGGGHFGSARLGINTIVGTRFWDCQQKFKIRVGPMCFHEYAKLLPAGDCLDRLAAWVALYTANEFEWEIQLVLDKDEIPPTRLGHVGQLGWSTWLHSQEPQADSDDLILSFGGNMTS